MLVLAALAVAAAVEALVDLKIQLRMFNIDIFTFLEFFALEIILQGLKSIEQ